MRVFHAVLDCVVPERCILCGDYILPGSRPGIYPVCGACASLKPILDEKRCIRCSMPLISEKGICMECRGRSFFFESNFSIFRYGDAGTMRSIHAYKSDGRISMAGFFAGKLAAIYSSRYADIPVVPVPCRRESRKKRGFDQIDLMCAELERTYRIRHIHMLERRGAAREQKILNREEREKNLQGRIFPRIRGTEAVPRSVVLLDDVFTTGATANECARVLKSLGIGKVFVLTIAID